METQVVIPANRRPMIVGRMLRDFFLAENIGCSLPGVKKPSAHSLQR